jgi:hypothetical protein
MQTVITFTVNPDRVNIENLNKATKVAMTTTATFQGMGFEEDSIILKWSGKLPDQKNMKKELYQILR